MAAAGHAPNRTSFQPATNDERPAWLSVEQPNKLELVINAGTEMAFGIAVPPLLLAQPKQVIP